MLTTSIGINSRDNGEVSWLWNNSEMINISQIGYIDNIATQFISHTGDNVCGDMFVKRNCEHTVERLI